MTENLKIIIAVGIGLIVVVVIAVTFGAMSASEHPGKCVGTWQAYGPFGSGITLVINHHGTGVMQGDLGSGDIKWRVENDQIVLEHGSEEFTGDLSSDNKSIQLHTGEYVLIFVKQ